MLSKSDFEKAANQIAEQFVAPGCESTLNQLAQKVAADNNLNPDQIRTMVRLANVSVFGKLFQTKTGSDRDIKFETADPEVVIDALYDDAKSLKVGTEKTAGYNRSSDYYGDLYAIEQVKEAAAPAEDKNEKPRYSKAELAMQLKRADDRFRLEGKQASQRWKMNMETAVSIYKKATGLKTAEEFPGFEREVLAADSALAPEVQALRAMVLGDKVAAYSDERIANIQNHHVANLQGDTKDIYKFLKVASDARSSFEECSRCQERIKNALGEL